MQAFLAATDAAQTDTTTAVLLTIMVFGARVVDMTLDTLRVTALVRGHRWYAAFYGFLEAGIFITAIAAVLSGPLVWYQMVAYAAGFGVGTAVGVTVARRLASEYLALRIFSRPHGDEICQALRDKGFAVTKVMGEGREGPVPVLFTVIRRSQWREAFGVVEKIHPKAFVLWEQAARPIGGFIPLPMRRTVSVRH